MNQNSIKNFYNEFVLYQRNSGVNERLFSLYKRLESLNLNSGSNVLELGCGIGILTKMISRIVKNGIIEAIDISDESIKHAKSKVGQKNVLFKVHDIVTFKPINNSIDFILLFDVLEHIPLDEHPILFKNLSEIADEKTKILINIPNPDYIVYDMENNPDTLQIIDQPVPLLSIFELSEKNNLHVKFYETYSVWVKQDYQFFIIEKKKAFQELKLSNERTLIEKVIHRLNNIYVSIKFS